MNWRVEEQNVNLIYCTFCYVVFVTRNYRGTIYILTREESIFICDVFEINRRILEDDKKVSLLCSFYINLLFRNLLNIYL